jgi:hypothetical protein
MLSQQASSTASKSLLRPQAQAPMMLRDSG